ncbi:MAG: hypothetical protein KKG75_00115 [Nanoarchaeota archaeon]|nr:hypothetical protein [Nanoarchaeota archaeon]
MVDVGKRDRVLSFVKEKGPVLPIQISKEFSIDTMFSGAMLSELVNERKVFSTQHLRVGGSPVYYAPGQEAKLENFFKYLNEKDISTITTLKEKGILADKSCSPLQRVSYRIVKDFAKSIVLRKDNDDKEVFWRYYLVDEDAAKEKILEMVNKVEKKPDKQKTVEEFKEKIKVEKEPKIVKEVEKPKLEEPLLREIEEDIVKEYFRTNGMTVWEEKVIRKKKEINYIVSFDSRIGTLKFFVKFKDKKRLNEGDISLAFNDAGNLPLLFLSKGDLSKTAKKLIDEKFKGGIIFKKLK